MRNAYHNTAWLLVTTGRASACSSGPMTGGAWMVVQLRKTPSAAGGVARTASWYHSDGDTEAN